MISPGLDRDAVVPRVEVAVLDQDAVAGLGVTAVELLPVHHFVSEGFLDGLGLSNYWGYSTVSFSLTGRATAPSPGGTFF